MSNKINNLGRSDFITIVSPVTAILSYISKQNLGLLAYAICIAVAAWIYSGRVNSGMIVAVMACVAISFFVFLYGIVIVAVTSGLTNKFAVKTSLDPNRASHQIIAFVFSAIPFLFMISFIAFAE